MSNKAGWNPATKKWIGPPLKVRIDYEYKCPYCGYVNTRSLPMGRIVCSTCGTSFIPR